MTVESILPGTRRTICINISVNALLSARGSGDKNEAEYDPLTK